MTAPLITAQVTGAAEVAVKLEAIKPAVQKELVMTIKRLAIDLQRHVKQDKLSGQVLKNRTGTLRRSITQKVVEAQDGVRGIVGTNVSYGKVWEFGYQGNVLIREAFGRQLKFPVWKRLNMPERSFLRSSLNDLADKIRKDIKEAVVRSAV